MTKFTKNFTTKLVIFDISILVLICAIYLTLDHLTNITKAETLTGAVRNEILMSDLRSLSRRLLSMVNENDFVSIVTPEIDEIKRERTFAEFEIFDATINIPVYTNTNTKDSQVSNLVFRYSLMSGLKRSLLAWLALNLILLISFPAFRKALEEQIRREEKTLFELRYAKMAKQVAHDIRSPLSVLEMALVDSSLSGEKKDLLTQASKRIKGIADDLLKNAKEFSALEKSKLPDSKSAEESAANLNQRSEKNLQAVSIGKSLGSILEEKKLLAPNVNFNLSLPKNDLLVQADEMTLSRIISNLLNNSIEAAKPDQPLNINISLRLYSGKVAVIIQDNGLGMDAETLAKVGAPGFTSKPNGNGLGVSAAKEKIREWGGDLQIASQQNQGTMVTLSLPQASPTSK